MRMCTSLAPTSMTVVIGLGTRLHLCMHTRLENGVLCNGLQPGSAVNSFFDHGKFEAMKMLSFSFSGFSVGFYINEEKVIWYQL